jgi:NAD(P)-dependent dehydrogenase (short-subunit alcohol dehydrogenase family)
LRGSGGIGSTIARVFAEYGVLVVGVHYNQFRNNAGHLIREIEKTGGVAEVLQGDLITDSPDQMIRSFIDFSDEVF